MPAVHRPLPGTPSRPSVDGDDGLLPSKLPDLVALDQGDPAGEPDLGRRVDHLDPRLYAVAHGDRTELLMREDSRREDDGRPLLLVALIEPPEVLEQIHMGRVHADLLGRELPVILPYKRGDANRVPDAGSLVHDPH